MTALALGREALGYEASGGFREGSLWSVSLALVVALHAGAALFMMGRTPPASPPGEVLPAVLIDMAPPAAAPAEPNMALPPSETIPESAAPDPVLEQVPDVPDPVVEPPAPQEIVLEAAPDAPPVEIPPLKELALIPPPVVPDTPAVVIPPPPRKIVRTEPRKPPPKVERKVVDKKPPRQVQAARPSEERVRERRPASEASGARTTASIPAASAGNAAASASSWKSRLVAHLQGSLRYPPGSRGAGSASVSFSMARSGRVLSASLARSAGDASLDAAALALFRGSLPAPPPEVPGQTFSFTIPIRFNAR